MLTNSTVKEQEKLTDPLIISSDLVLLMQNQKYIYTFTINNNNKLVFEKCLQGLNITGKNNVDTQKVTFEIMGADKIKQVFIKLKEAKLVTQEYLNLIRKPYKNFQSRTKNNLIINDVDYHSLFNTRKILKNELKNIYNYFDDLIVKKLSELNNNKKLLVIAGEGHNQKKSLVIEMVLISILKKYGIQNIATETSEKFIETIRYTKPKMNNQNFDFIVLWLDKMGLNIVSCDPDQNQPNNMREQDMKSALMKLNENTLFICGLFHLFPLFKKQDLRKQFDILPINIAHLTNENIIAIKKSCYEALLKKTLDSRMVEQVNIKTEINYLPYEELIKTCEEIIIKIENEQMKEQVQSLALTLTSSLGLFSQPYDDRKKDESDTRYSLNKN